MTTPEPWQLLPELSAEEYAALKADIAAQGVLVPVVVDAESGQLIEGHHRVRAFSELRAEGVKVPDYLRQVRRFADDDERAAFVVAANLFRRHLTRAQRAEVVAKLRQKGWSLRRIGEAVGVSAPTVRRELVTNVTIELPERVERKGGGTYPARRPRPAPSIVVGSARDEGRAVRALATLGADAPRKVLALDNAERRARAADYERLRESTPPVQRVSGESWELRCGDFASVLEDLAPESVDLVLCDPPYTDEFGQRWRELSALAARSLAPGGSAVFYSGHHNLPEVIAQLCEHLSWCWHVALVQPGRECRFNAAKVHNGHRDLLVLTNGPAGDRRWLRDTLTSPPESEKGLHPWQQTVAPARYIIDIFSEPGGLVLDPCCGSGSFGVAALGSGRRFLGCDVDPVTIGVAGARLADDAADGAGATTDG